MCATMALTCVFAVSSAGATPTQLSVSISSTSAWTNTGIRVTAGETVVVQAHGTVRFRAPASTVGPQGVAWGATCNHENTATVATPWPVSGIACWSLIGRVGTGRPFEIGRAARVTAASSGELQLGINDNYIADNAGSWTALVSVSGASAAVPSAVAQAAPAKHGSNLVLIAIVGLVAVLAIVGLILLARRSRKRAPETDMAMVAAVAASMSAESRSVHETDLLLLPTEDDHTVVPSEHDATKVNIFEVTLTTSVLRVGYSYFPEGVEVQWSIRRGIATRAAGAYVTNGGGDTEHYVSFPVDVARDDDRDTSVEFHWSIDGVPFAYSVRRDPVEEPKATLDQN